MNGEFSNFIGSWVHTLPGDTDDYLSEFTVSGSAEHPVVTAVDLSDGEEFEISDIKWNGNELTFKSLMPSTKREGLNRFRLGENGNIVCEFTFTVVEELKRHTT